MKFEITELVKRSMLEGWPKDMDPRKNPIKDGVLYFDALRVETASDAIGGHRLVLSCCGRDVATARVGHFEMGMNPHIDGIEGTPVFRLGVE